MNKEFDQMKILNNQELLHVQGGSVWGWVKKAARWVKKHVKITKKSISVKGKHDIGGG